LVVTAQQGAEALIARIVQARARLAEAAATADLPGIAEALDDLEEAYGLAATSGVAIPRPDTGLDGPELDGSKLERTQ
jgi:hypothetical protein